MKRKGGSGLEPSKRAKFNHVNKLNSLINGSNEEVWNAIQSGLKFSMKDLLWCVENHQPFKLLNLLKSGLVLPFENYNIVVQMGDVQLVEHLLESLNEEHLKLALQERDGFMMEMLAKNKRLPTAFHEDYKMWQISRIVLITEHLTV